MIEYAVLKKDGMWCLFQCGQQIRVFSRRDAAANAARELAQMILSPEVAVRLLVQTSTGELQREPVASFH